MGFVILHKLRDDLKVSVGERFNIVHEDEEYYMLDIRNERVWVQKKDFLKNFCSLQEWRIKRLSTIL